MFRAQRDKRIETDRTQTTPAQEVTNQQRVTHQGADPTSLPLYTQAWGNLPPPWLRLSVSQQAPQAEGEPLQRMAEATQRPEPTQRKENSTALPDTLKIGIEALSGMAMDDVQVHYHSSKPAQVQALAYTQGTDIHVGPGQEQHLAHEAWHVVQQKLGQVRPTLQARGVAINNDERLEHEADVLGAKAQQYGRSMEPVAVMRGSARPASKVMQGKFAVQISLENLDIEDRSDTGAILTTTHKELRIGSVHIADRPPGLLSPDEKSHTTAWALFTDQLRNAILGKTVAAAVQTVHNLYKDAQHLPGVARVGNLFGNAKVVYDNAKQRMDKLLTVNLLALAEERRLDLLQRLGEGFLAYRNAIPLSQVDIGRATGHGEPEVLKNLRPWNDLRQGWEENPEQQGTMRMQAGVPKQTREAMWSLLDTGVIESIFMLRATSATAPGVSEGPGGATDGGAAQRIADIIVQHLWTLESAYETAFREAQMDSEDSIRTYLQSVGCRGLYQDLIYDKITAHYAHAPEKLTEENIERYRTAGPAGQADFSIQVYTDQKSMVKEMNVGGRAVTLLGTSQGSHSTAWITYVDAVRNQVIGKQLGQAVQNILALCKTAETLPGMKRVDQLDEKQKYWFTLAVNELKAAQNYALGVTNSLEYLPALQRLIKAYLGFRNAVPLSQIKGGLADANSEAQHRARLRYLESGFKEWTGVGQAPDPHDKTIYFQSFWELYDYNAMRKAVFHEVEPADAPGISNKESGLQIAADSVKQHLLTMKDAYPKSNTLFNTVESIHYVLGKMNLHNQDYPEILKLING